MTADAPAAARGATHRALGRRPAYDIDRVRAFSDCVFAVAITVVVVSLQVPESTSSAPRLEEALREDALHFAAYLAGFVVIGFYWMSHHRTFDLIVRADGTMLWLNLAFLFFVVSSPFPTLVLAEYRSFPVAHFVFNLNATLLGLINVAVWAYATRGHRLVGPQLSDRALQIYRWRAAMFPAAFALATVGSLVSIPLAIASWGLLVIGRLALRLALGPMPPEERAEEDAEVDEPVPHAAATAPGGGTGGSAAARPRSGQRAGRNVARLLSFSDNIYAFAITLPILGFTLPANPLATNDDLTAYLGDLNSDTLVFLIGFAVTGLFWSLHNKVFLLVDRQDGVLRVLNLVHLLAVALLPFSTRVETTWGTAPAAAGFYALVAGIAGATLAAIVWYATLGHRLVDPDLPESELAFRRWLALVVPLSFLASMPLAYVSVSAAQLLWYAPFVVVRVAQHRFESRKTAT